jgi:uncharacterized protein DUF2796
MKFATVTAIATALFVSPAFAEEHRELGPHVHGHGTLDIAVEGTKVSMSLEVPGMDIVGFEHAAESADQKSAVDKGTATLSTPLALFKIPAAAGCKVSEAKVAIEPEHEHGDGDDDHDAKEGADHDHDHDGKEAADHDHDEHEGHAGHNQFHATYALECAKPAEITAITFDYFKSFAGAQGLTVNVVTAKAQNSYEVKRDKPELDLGGMM